MAVKFNGKKVGQKIAVMLISVIVLSTLSVFLIGFVTTTELLICDGEIVKQVATQKTTVAQVLEENNIVLGEKDHTDYDLSADVSDINQITIHRAFPMTLVVAGTKREIKTSQTSVWEVLADEGVVLSEYDEVSPAYLDETFEGMTITVDKITKVVEGYESELKYETEYRENDSQYKSYRNVITKGENGVKKNYYEYVKRNGELVETNFVGTEIIEECVNEVVEIGTKSSPRKVTDKGLSDYNFPIGQRYKEDDFSYSRKITVEATAYDSTVTQTNSYGGYTASGLYMGYGIIAVDPRIIPLGSKLYVESPDGGKSWTYGYCIAGDTGGAIKGYRIDLFYWDRYDAIQFGRRKATVYVLD